MRIRIGQRKFDGANNAAIRDAISDVLQGAIAKETLEVTGPRLRAVAKDMEAAGEAQARQIMGTIARVIGNGWGEIYGKTADPLRASRGSPPAWAPLNFKYALWKERQTAARMRGASKADISRAAGRAGGHFVFKGGLQRYFEKTPRNFGGVKVKVVTAGLGKRVETTALHSGLRAKVQTPGSDKKLLGRFTITVLPRLATHLMPGLSSRRWSDAGSKEFDRTTFGDKIGHKLVGGKHVPYRPLALPIIQFFTLVRIPGAVRSQLNKSIRLRLGSSL